MTTPSTAAKRNGQYEASPSSEVVTGDVVVVVVAATGRTSPSLLSGAGSATTAALVRCAAFALGRVVAVRRFGAWAFGAAVAVVATATVRAFRRGAGGSG